MRRKKEEEEKNKKKDEKKKSVAFRLVHHLSARARQSKRH
jgi:hypothetical protein